MKNAPLMVFVIAIAGGACAWALEQQKPASAALKGASLESHEAFTISAQPWTQAGDYKEKFPKKSPFEAGLLAVRVAFRNDSDQSVKVDLERIRLNLKISDEQRQDLQPLTAEEVADEVLDSKKKDPTKRSKLPIPIRKPPARHDKNWTEMEQSARNAGVAASVVAPHSTVEGLLYFDLQGQFEMLASSHLYVPDLKVLEKDRSLTFFEIDLSQSAGR